LGDDSAQREAGQLLSVYAPDFALARRESEAQVGYLLELAARYDLDNGCCFNSDESAALLSKFHTALSRDSSYRHHLGGLRWAYDKRLTYQLAAEQKSTTVNIYRHEVDLEGVHCFSRILKPATHATINRFTADKAWPVANREELLARTVKPGS